jgi:hypothetical protein
MTSIRKFSHEGIVAKEAGMRLRGRSPFPARFIKRALDIFLEHDVEPPDQVRLEILVGAAMEAQHLFLTAAIHEPTSAEFGALFDEFVLLLRWPLPCADRAMS